MLSVGQSKTKIKKNSGKILKTEEWGLKNLTYEIKKSRRGHFVHIKFDGNGTTIQELENAQNINYEQEKLRNAISLLDNRSKDIIASRWLAEKKKTLHDLAAIHNISAERVRQIENAAINKLKKSIKN